MLHLHNISKSYNSHLILDQITLSVLPGNIVALIGENGAGKTTLLQIIKGLILPDSGELELGHNVIGYVPQEPIGTRKSMGDSFGSIEPWQVDRALSLVDLVNIDKERMVTSLSGGQKTRLAIAQVLAQDPMPNVLLLDEPTNNLDRDGINWLKVFLNKFKGSILFVSHDRGFINATANNIIELHGGKLIQYGGNYDFYLEQKELERRCRLERYDAMQREKKRLTKSIAEQKEKSVKAQNFKSRSDTDKMQRDFFRNRVSSKFGRQAKSMEKRLEQLEQIEKPGRESEDSFILSGFAHSNKKIISLKHLSKRFGNQEIIADLNLEIYGRDRIHICGKNGSGKTTVLKIIAGLLKPDDGIITYGPNITIGYYGQDTDGLNNDKTALDNLMINFKSGEFVYRQAKSLDLSAEDLLKIPRDLSRGQQAKLAFAKLLLGNHSLLILDEPTNHLDIPARVRLENSLNNYAGALLVVSHDQYFLDQININNRIELKKLT